VPYEKLFEYGFKKRYTKDEMGGGNFENLSGNQFFRKISDFLGSLLHFLFLNHCHFLKKRFTIPTA
jgi:hypothetical protein